MKIVARSRPTLGDLVVRAKELAEQLVVTLRLARTADYYEEHGPQTRVNLKSASDAAKLSLTALEKESR